MDGVPVVPASGVEGHEVVVQHEHDMSALGTHVGRRRLFVIEQHTAPSASIRIDLGLSFAPQTTHLSDHLFQEHHTFHIHEGMVNCPWFQCVEFLFKSFICERMRGNEIPDDIRRIRLAYTILKLAKGFYSYKKQQQTTCVSDTSRST
jgi:hypothetical protein